MKVLGVGMGRTGTASLARALRTLGYRTLHWAPDYLADVFEKGVEPDLARYNGWDAVTDIPAALFYREVLAAYPACQFILTVRDEQEWLESIRALYENPNRFDRLKQFPPQHRAWLAKISEDLRKFAYGSEKVLPALYLRRYREHIERVQNVIPAGRLLVMDITRGEGWEKLCPFLGKPFPPEPFPHANARVRK
ncbi:MAG: hypothetical protein HKN82_06040 [Akkermansiaceae bacterium]|nr:hypothetical protein [Akkermansiaceae bacterium]NNM30660.1 hypothetical protein [Akkermansiaceae bacterium]